MGGHSSALLLIMPFHHSGMRSKGVGSRWTSKPPLQAKMQAKLKPINRNIVEIFGNITVGGFFIPSLGIIGTLEFNNVISF